MVPNVSQQRRLFHAPKLLYVQLSPNPNRLCIWIITVGRGLSIRVRWDLPRATVWQRGSMWCSCTQTTWQSQWDNSQLHKRTQGLSAQYDREFADPWSVCDGWEARLATYYSCIEASPEFSRIFQWDYGGISKYFCIFSPAFESVLAFGLRKFLMGLARCVNNTVGVHRSRIVKLLSSVLDASELESRCIVEVPGYPECSGTLSSADLDPQACSPDPPSYSPDFFENKTSLVGILLRLFACL